MLLPSQPIPTDQVGRSNYTRARPHRGPRDLGGERKARGGGRFNLCILGGEVQQPITNDFPPLDIVNMSFIIGWMHS